MKTNLLITLISILAVSFASASKTTEEHVQSVREIGRILAEYTQKKGSTPFAENWKNSKPDDEDVPVIILSHLSQKEIPEQLAYPPFSCDVIEAKELEEYLSKTLGRKVSLPRDDRELTVKGRPMPLFYTVQIDDGKFFVATYLTEAHKDARKLAENWYKFEVGSVAVPEKKIEKAVAPEAPAKK